MSGATGLVGATGPEEADWAEARLTAAQWAASQLAAAGVSPAPPPAPTPAPAQPLPSRRRSGRRGWALVAFFLGFLLCAVIAALSVTLGSGSSLGGGIGASGFAPATAPTVSSQYHLGVGNLDVDLSAVKFPAGGKTVHVSLGIGHLTVEVPDNAVVNVNAHAGVGEVDVFGNSGRDVQQQWAPKHSGNKTPHLTLDAHVGVGYVEVTRG